MLELEGNTSINTGSTVPESSDGSLPNRIEKNLLNQYTLFSGVLQSLNIKAVGGWSKLLDDASLLPSYPPIKVMRPVGNVLWLAYLRTNKWILRFNTTRVRASIYTQKYNTLLRRRPLPRLEIFPTYHHFCQIRKHRLYLFCTLWNRLDHSFAVCSLTLWTGT